jgi:hypothetical protein
MCRQLIYVDCCSEFKREREGNLRLNRQRMEESRIPKGYSI